MNKYGNITSVQIRFNILNMFNMHDYEKKARKLTYVQQVTHIGFLIVKIDEKQVEKPRQKLCKIRQNLMKPRQFEKALIHKSNTNPNPGKINCSIVFSSEQLLKN